ncbi:MAG: hypothetical protein KGN37_03970 [Burkholderiales bacterium]|nr:hypothetical protein [Burkholderiales bacterium]MDE2431990.1 hypothetical protein [Burkholderiales bacterium]
MLFTSGNRIGSNLLTYKPVLGFMGGTKREIYLSYGVAYNDSPDTVLTLRTYGYNNLNRGSSAMSPFGFKDGLSVTCERSF